MPRPKRKRIVCREPDYICFRADGIPPAEAVVLTVDEFETIRLVDLEKQTHEETARQMQVSRTTVTEIYESARFKLADSIVNGKNLLIEGGHYQLCEGTQSACSAEEAARRCKAQMLCCDRGSCAEAFDGKAALPRKGWNHMRIAVTYENGNIFQHFGHTEEFKVYDVEDGKVRDSRVIGTNGTGHGALAGLLAEGGVDVLICGGIGGGAQTALAEAGVKLYGGVSGSADAAVQALLDGSLAYNPNVQCNHHGEGHGHGEAGHSCGHHGEGQGHSCGGHGGCGNH